MHRNYTFKIHQDVKGAFPGEVELKGTVTDRTAKTVFVHWEGFSSPIEYIPWQFEYIKPVRAVGRKRLVL